MGGDVDDDSTQPGKTESKPHEVCHDGSNFKEFTKPDWYTFRSFKCGKHAWLDYTEWRMSFEDVTKEKAEGTYFEHVYTAGGRIEAPRVTRFDKATLGPYDSK